MAEIEDKGTRTSSRTITIAETIASNEKRADEDWDMTLNRYKA
jgi:hypothetical protein